MWEGKECAENAVHKIDKKRQSVSLIYLLKSNIWERKDNTERQISPRRRSSKNRYNNSWEQLALQKYSADIVSQQGLLVWEGEMHTLKSRCHADLRWI